MFKILSRSIKSKKKKSQDFLFTPFYFTTEKKMYFVNFCNQGLLLFSVTLVNHKSLLLRKLTIPNKPHLNFFFLNNTI